MNVAGASVINLRSYLLIALCALNAHISSQLYMHQLKHVSVKNAELLCANASAMPSV